MLYTRPYLPFTLLQRYSRNDHVQVEIHLIAYCKAILAVKVFG